MKSGPSRRDAFAQIGQVVRQGPQGEVRLAPRADLVNVLEFEEQARRTLAPEAFAKIAGGDRSAFDRLTLQPRVMVPTRGMDLGLTLFGHVHHNPIIAGPVGPLDSVAEAALLRGASAANATLIATGATAVRPEARASKTPVWCQVFASDATAIDAIKRAVDAGCRAACVTVGAEPTSRGARGVGVDARQWRTIEAAAKTATVPVVAKGITSPAAAKLALQHGASGLVFSNYGGLLGSATRASVLELPAVVEAVAGKVPVLTDGGFRRGTDILKALALGASAVLVARPVAWGLSAYGAEGVQSVLEMLQTELARYMAMSCKPNLQAIDRAMVKIHAR